MKLPGLIQGRRAELGLTRVQLAKQARLHAGVVADIEASNELSDLSLNQIRRLELTLGIALLEDSRTRQLVDLDRDLGAIIVDGRLAGLPIDAAARVLGCDLREVHEATENLREHLKAAGMTLRGQPDTVPSVARDCDSVLDQAIDREASGYEDGELSDGELRVILRVAALHRSPDCLPFEFLAERERKLVGSLAKRGYLVVVDHAIELTDRTAESLNPILEMQELSPTIGPRHWAQPDDPGQRFTFVPNTSN